jgi:hypothetical protein
MTAPPDSIPLRPVDDAIPVPRATAYEAPYRWFIAASLTLGIGGGFLLAVLLPLARAEEWGWGSGIRWQALIQVHGQLQLMGFGGLFVMGMAFRLIPRFSGRPLAFSTLVPALIPIIATSLILRSVAEPWTDGVVRNVGIVTSAALLLAAGLAFAAVICGTLLHRDSKAEATGYFFVLGSLGFCVGAVLNLMQVIEIVRDGLPIAPASKETAQVFTQQYGFLIMFLSGVGSRAVPTFTGSLRRNALSRMTAFVLAAGVALFAGAMLWITYRSPTTAAMRFGDVGLLLTGLAFAMLVRISGALWPSKNHVAAASQTAFWFVRSAYAWLLVAAALTGWYGGRGFLHGDLPDSFELDGVRHVLTIGVLTMMIVGMGLLIVPEFAGRRLQHPDERLLLRGMVVALNLAAALRLWPALEGINWLASTRYWPISAAGGLASAVVVVFGAMFAQSFVEQRKRGWGRKGRAASLKAPGLDT